MDYWDIYSSQVGYGVTYYQSVREGICILLVSKKRGLSARGEGHSPCLIPREELLELDGPVDRPGDDGDNAACGSMGMSTGIVGEPIDRESGRIPSVPIPPAPFTAPLP